MEEKYVTGREICRAFIEKVQKFSRPAERIQTTFKQSSIFGSIFNLEESAELTEPTPFYFGDDVKMLWIEKVSPELWTDKTRFRQAMINGDLLAKRYRLFAKYEVVFLVDVSMSSLKRFIDYEDALPMWWEETTYSGKHHMLFTKWAMVLYLCVRYLFDARQQGLSTRLIPFGCNRPIWFDNTSNSIEHLLFNLCEAVEREKQTLQRFDGNGDTSILKTLETVINFPQSRHVMLFTDLIVSSYRESLIKLINHMRTKHNLTICIVRDAYEMGFHDEQAKNRNIAEDMMDRMIASSIPKLGYDFDNINTDHLQAKTGNPRAKFLSFIQLYFPENSFEHPFFSSWLSFQSSPLCSNLKNRFQFVGYFLKVRLWWELREKKLLEDKAS